MSIEKLRAHLIKQDRLHHRATKTAFHHETVLAYPELSVVLRALLDEHEHAYRGSTASWIEHRDHATDAIQRYGESE